MTMISNTAASTLLYGSNTSSFKQFDIKDRHPLAIGNFESTEEIGICNAGEPVRLLRVALPAPPPSLYHGTKWRRMICRLVVQNTPGRRLNRHNNLILNKWICVECFWTLCYHIGTQAPSKPYNDIKNGCSAFIRSRQHSFMHYSLAQSESSWELNHFRRHHWNKACSWLLSERRGMGRNIGI